METEKTENSLFKYITPILVTIIFAFIAMTYSGLVSSDKEQKDNQKVADAKFGLMFTNLYIICQNQPKGSTKCKDIPDNYLSVLDTLSSDSIALKR